MLQIHAYCNSQDSINILWLLHTNFSVCIIHRSITTTHVRDSISPHPISVCVFFLNCHTVHIFVLFITRSRNTENISVILSVFAIALRLNFFCVPEICGRVDCVSRLMLRLRPKIVSLYGILPVGTYYTIIIERNRLLL